MSIQVTSTTDPQAAVLASSESASESKVDEKSPAPSEEKSEQGEKVEESDPSNEETETKEESEDESQESEKSDEDGEESEEKRESKPRPNGFKRRIDKLNKRLTDKEREMEYWKQEALKGKATQEPQRKDEAPKTIQVEGKPSPDSYETHAEYIDALTDWKIEQRDKQKEIQAREAQLKTETQKQVQTFQSKVKEFKDVHDDFDDAMTEVDDIAMSIGIQETILSSEFGPQLMYELAKNREEYERINKLSPYAAARELGKIEARISSQSSDKQEIKKTTKAPTPLTPVGGKGSSSSKKTIWDAANESQAAYERARREQSKRA